MNRFKNVIVSSPLVVAVFVLSLSSAVNIVGAQGAGALRQLDGRASPSLRAQVIAVADAIARAGLPVAPLVDKTLEGISKGADDQRIIIAVRGIAADLGVARRALGPSSDDELAAAVAALRAGSGAGGLTELRRALPGRPLVVPLSVLASLLVEGAAAPSAIVAVVSNARQRTDVDLLAYGRSVSRDIASGVAPLTAMSGALGVAPLTAMSGALGPGITATNLHGAARPAAQPVKPRP